MPLSLLHYNNNTEEIAAHGMISGYCIDESLMSTGEKALAYLGNPFPYTKTFLNTSCTSLINEVGMPTTYNPDQNCRYYWSRILNPTNQEASTCPDCPLDCVQRITFCSIEENKTCACCENFDTNSIAIWLMGDCDAQQNKNKNFITRPLHWLNGGYFYANKNLRDYIYDEKGTIHFSTNVKYDIVDNSDENYDFIPLLDIGYSSGYLTLSQGDTSTASLLAQKIFKLNPAANSLGYNYSIFKLQSVKQIKTLVSTIRYNTITKAFDSKFVVNDKFISNCGYGTCIEFDSYETQDSDNIMVMLSTGNITHFPLTNELVNYTQRAVNSFTMMEDLYKTYYYDFVTPIKNVYNNNDLVTCDVSYGSYNAYYINNSFNTPYPLVTTAVSITDGTNTYGNYKWRVTIKKDPSTGEIYLNLDDAQSTAIMYNEFNEPIYDEAPYLVLDRILNYMKNNYPDLNIHTTLYETTGSSLNISLVKTKNIITPGTFYVSHIIEKDPYDSRSGQYRMRINLSKEIQNTIDAGYTDSLKISGSTASTFLLMFKASSFLKGYRNNTIDTTSSYHQNIVSNEVSFEPTSEISIISEQTLFNYNSSKFSTPDYTSVTKNTTNTTIPLRGSEYSEIEKNNYPKIRYVRKADGKFYIQILAGAFPYYHSVVHYPVVKEMEKCVKSYETGDIGTLLISYGPCTETPCEWDLNGDGVVDQKDFALLLSYLNINQGPCNGRAVENSLKQICSKSVDWYNHTATTKWICYIKHTEFGDDPISYTQTESDKQIIKGPNQKIYGSGKNKNPGTGSGGSGGAGTAPGTAEIVANPNTIGTSGGTTGGGSTGFGGSSPIVIGGGTNIGSVDRITAIE